MTESKQLKTLIESFRAKKLTLSFAESCTGGKLSAILTEQAGVSDIFLGSVVSYSNRGKEDLLGVRRDTLLEEGAVSETVARQMAQGVRKQFHSDWSVAITGIAGPSGGSSAKPVGTVCFAVCGSHFEAAITKHFTGDRIAIQLAAAEFAMELLVDALKK